LGAVDGNVGDGNVGDGKIGERDDEVIGGGRTAGIFDVLEPPDVAAGMT
jgi:hypothetical protein